MTEAIKLTLPYPPYVNNMYITLMLKGKPVRVPSGQAKKYKTAAGKLCQHLRPFKGEVRLELKVFRPRRIGDLDGTFKALIDVMSGHAFLDDKQIVEIHARRFEDKNNPRVEVEITELSSAPELFSEQEPELIY